MAILCHRFCSCSYCELTLVALGAIGVAPLDLPSLSKKGGNGGGGAATSNDQLATFSEDY